MTSTATLEFKAEGVDGKPFAFGATRNNQRAKILLLIDAQVDQNGMSRLRGFVQAVTWMLQAQPILEDALDFIPLVSLQIVAKFGSKDQVRTVIGEVLQRLSLSSDAVGRLIVLDWQGDAIEAIRLSMARVNDPNALSTADVASFDKHSLWMLVTNESNEIISALFSVPVPQDASEFTDFVNDVVSAAPSAEAQNAIVKAFNEYYIAHPVAG